jgi:PST family polysaccharide transporter
MSSQDITGKIIFRSVSWLALGKVLSQALSWTVTLVIANILDPSVYGLMALSTIISGYAEIISELGLGPAIIQRTEVTQKELSSIFWLSIVFGIMMWALCWPISYLTYDLFGDRDTLVITQTVGFIFVMSGIQVVPISLLKKKLMFRPVAIIEVISVIFSCSSMLVIAKSGGGVWTLVAGSMMLSLSRTILVFILGEWRPSMWLRLDDIRKFVRFGFSMTLARSTFYMWERSDKYFAGMFWKTSSVGLYTFALTLSQLPTEKIVTLINQVLYSCMAKVKSDPVEFNKLYLQSMKYTSFVVLPLFTAGYLFSEELIKLFFNQKWHAIIPLFSLLCISQIFLALNAVNNFVHAALGRPYFGLLFHIVCLIAMPVSFRFAAPHGITAYAYPWIGTFAIISTIWIIITLKTIRIPIWQYLGSIRIALIGSFSMILMVSILKRAMLPYGFNTLHYPSFALLAFIACLTYLTCVLVIDRSLLRNLMSVIGK